MAVLFPTCLHLTRAFTLTSSPTRTLALTSNPNPGRQPAAQPDQAAGGLYLDRGLEDFRAVAEARGLALRRCPQAASAGDGDGSAAVAAAGAGAASQAEGANPLEVGGDAAGSEAEFTWPLEAFADARPFVVELVLSAEAPRT